MTVTLMTMMRCAAWACGLAFEQHRSCTWWVHGSVGRSQGELTQHRPSHGLGRGQTGESQSRSTGVAGVRVRLRGPGWTTTNATLDASFSFAPNILQKIGDTASADAYSSQGGAGRGGRAQPM